MTSWNVLHPTVMVAECWGSHGYKLDETQSCAAIWVLLSKCLPSLKAAFKQRLTSAPCRMRAAADVPITCLQL